MARASVSVQDVVVGGLNASYDTMTGDGISFENGSNVFAHVKATTGATITITTPATFEGLDLEDRTISVSGGEEQFIGPFNSKIYEQSDGTVYIDTDQTDTDIAILRL